MKTVAVVGLYSIPNMGDKILCETAQFLIKQIDPDIKIVEVDVNPRGKKYFKGKAHITYTCYVLMKKIANTLFVYNNSSRLRYYYEYFMWWLKVNSLFKKSLKNVDAIIFAGGGFLKFRTQGLNYYIEQIVRIAIKNNIPVMMNGVGVEGYDENDIRCQKLKKIINKDCVKIITTRDDINILANKYITNSSILTARVGDCALWTPECYNIKKQNNSNVVGINVIRGNVFKDYGNKSSALYLKNFYKNLITELEHRDIDWVLFSNGMKSDQTFGAQILREMGLHVREKLFPAPKTSLQLLNLIKDFKGIFGARLHACITAYSIDVPVVGIIWNVKTKIFSEVIGKPQNFFSESNLHINDIIDTLENSFEDKYDDKIRDELKLLTKKYIEIFLQQI